MLRRTVTVLGAGHEMGMTIKGTKVTSIEGDEKTGAKIVLRRGATQVLSAGIDNALVEPGNQLELTDALAQMLDLEDTVDYREVVACVRAVSDAVRRSRAGISSRPWSALSSSA